MPQILTATKQALPIWITTNISAISSHPQWTTKPPKSQSISCKRQPTTGKHHVPYHTPGTLHSLLRVTTTLCTYHTQKQAARMRTAHTQPTAPTEHGQARAREQWPGHPPTLTAPLRASPASHTPSAHTATSFHLPVHTPHPAVSSNPNEMVLSEPGVCLWLLSSQRKMQSEEEFMPCHSTNGCASPVISLVITCVKYVFL